MSVTASGLPADAPYLSHTGSASFNTKRGIVGHINTAQNGDSEYRRLGAEDVHYHEAQSLHPARLETPPLPTNRLPFQRDPAFVDRRELIEVQEKMSQPGARVALVGLGGIGKSQLVTEFCYRLQSREPDTSVLWLRTSSAARFDQDIRELADDIKIPGAEGEKADIYQLVYGWLNDSRRKWLIVLANVDYAEFLFDIPESTGTASKPVSRIEYLPLCSHGSILVTSKCQEIATRLVDQSKIVKLRPDEQHSIALLKSKLIRQGDATDLAQLAETLKYMPLAVAQAAAYMNKRWPPCSVEEYLKKLEKKVRAQTSLLGVDSPELCRRTRDAKSSILLTWQISFEHICATRRSAADLLSLMSFYDFQGIPESLLRSSTSVSNARPQSYRDTDEDNSCTSYGEGGFEVDVDTLRDYSFITKVPGGSTFEMHRLVRLAMQMWLKESGKHQDWEVQSLRGLDSVFLVDKHARWETCQILYPHAKLALDSDIDERDAQLSLSSISIKVAWFTRSQGLYELAVAAAKRSIAIRESILGADDRDTLASIGILASILQDQGKYQEAEAMNRRALIGGGKALGNEHPFTITSVSNLAGVLQSQGKYNEAEAMNRCALEGYEKVLGMEHPFTLTSVSNLALVLQNQGKYEEAEAINRRALDGGEKVLGKEHSFTLTSVSNLAGVLQYRGRYDEAEAMNRRAMDGRERVLGMEHPYTLISIDNLAAVLKDQEKYGEAEAMNRRVLGSRERMLGKEHPDTLTSLDNLALVLQDQGRYEEAEEMNRRALGGYEKVLGKEHPDTLISVWCLAELQRRHGNHHDALELYQRAVIGFSKGSVLAPTSSREI